MANKFSTRRAARQQRTAAARNKTSNKSASSPATSPSGGGESGFTVWKVLGDLMVGIALGLLIFHGLSIDMGKLLQGLDGMKTTTKATASTNTGAVEASATTTTTPALKGTAAATADNTPKSEAQQQQPGNTNNNPVVDLTIPEKPDGPTVGLVLPHCNEGWEWMQFIEQVPKHWRFVIYEQCGQRTSKASRPMANTRTGEYCVGYLQHIIDNYDNLPDVNIFLSNGALIGFGGPDQKYDQVRTPFTSLKELFDHTMKYSATWKSDNGDDDKYFLHYGRGPLKIENVNFKDPFMGYHPREILDLMGMDYLKAHENNDATGATLIGARQAACFAVSKQQIQFKSKEQYQKLQDSIFAAVEIRDPNISDRRRCCALERLWHVIFGLPYNLPSQHTVDHLWSSQLNRFVGTWEEAQKRKQQ